MLRNCILRNCILRNCNLRNCNQSSIHYLPGGNIHRSVKNY
ncbi:hypothetical protein GM921_00505 [Pedobacter sp. LMG 31464]|uniref:Pentapeptide repeat-containing protein n=1 Tax=Pedobacter planticolens TaxID=2679964 RepID=A0A923DVS0_9SPHI|nr:hypothetical protein [Pedobacter planticolens]